MAGKKMKGKKISKAEAAKLDKNKMGPCQVDPPEAEVEGQELQRRLAECPYCSRTSWIVYDTVNYLWYTCCYCGGRFRA